MTLEELDKLIEIFGKDAKWVDVLKVLNLLIGK